MLVIVFKTSYFLFLALSQSLFPWLDLLPLNFCHSSSVPLSVSLPPTLSDTVNYSCVTEMSSAGVGEERIDNDYTWPLPWQLFQLMCVPVRSTRLRGGKAGGGRETQTYEAMPVTWSKSERGWDKGGRDKGVFHSAWQQHPVCPCFTLR